MPRFTTPVRGAATACLALTLAACAVAPPAVPSAPTVPPAPSAAPAPHAAHADADADAACRDFDAHVNGAWARSAELPPDRARVGSFDTLRRDGDRVLERALDALAADPSRRTTPGLRLLAAYYRSGTDIAAIERHGLSALAPLLDRIAALHDRDALPALVGALARAGADAPLAVGVGVDARDATRHVLSIAQGGLGLPDRADYGRTDADAARTVAAYRRHAATLLDAAGTPVDDAALDALLAFETALARASMTRVERRDPTAVYHPTTLAALRRDAPGFDWPAWLGGYGAVPADAPIVVAQPAFVREVARLATEAPLATWRHYLRVRLIDAAAMHGPAGVAQSHFDYHQGAIRGLRARPPRAEELILAIGGRYGSAPLGEALGELFVAEAFSPLAQARAEAMVADIRSAMRARIAVLPWMSEPTRRFAQDKLDRMVAKIGRPERWQRYEGLALADDDFAGNLLRVRAWSTDARLRDLGRPVDRERWHTSPHVVNAFATGGNQIVFPAAILQPPFFDPAADDATNYGAIGMVIGHEITHHFDDRGRQFDAVGNLRPWWSDADAAAYRERAGRVAALYDRHEPLPGVRIDGRLTLGENISDIAGLQIAYDGLQIALARRRATGTAEAEPTDGLTPEQRFFRANAIVWRTKTRPEALAAQLRTDSHAPARWRILLPMSQSPAFAAAWGCRDGDAMKDPEPIGLW